MIARRKLSNEIRWAWDRGVAWLADRVDARGRFHGGCEGRMLETALTYAVLTRIGRAPDVRDRLRAACRHHLETVPAPSLASDSPLALHELVEHVAAAQVVGGTIDPARMPAITRVLTSFTHPSQARKGLLLATVLAELGLTPTPEPPTHATIHGSEHHLWTRLALTAAAMLAGDHDPEHAAFLRRHASPNGTWENHLLVTTLALLALAPSNEGDPVFERGIAALVSAIRPDGRVPFIADEDTWMTCLSGYVMSSGPAPVDVLARMRRYVIAEQQADGGWSYAEDVRQCDADDTAMAMAFLASGGPSLAPNGFTGSIALQSGADHLARLSNRAGGVPTFVPGADPDVEITAKALLALGAAGRLDRDRADRGLAFLCDRQRSDGSFRTEWKICPTYPIFHVLHALARLDTGRDPRSTTLRARALAYLQRHRRSDGGWAMVPGQTTSHLLSTAYAVGAIACADPAALVEPQGMASLRILLEAQRSDGSFACAGDSLGPRPFVYDVPALATVYTLWALALVRDARLHATPSLRSTPIAAMLEVA